MQRMRCLALVCAMAGLLQLLSGACQGAAHVACATSQTVLVVVG